MFLPKNIIANWFYPAHWHLTAFRLFLITLFGLLWAISWSRGIQLAKVEVAPLTIAEGSPENVRLPFLRHERPGFYKFKISFSYSRLQSPVLWFVPDDCITQIWLNGIQVPLSTIIAGNLCDYRYGAKIDLSSFVKSGENKLEIVVENGDGLMGLSVMTVLASALDPQIAATVLLILFFLSYSLPILVSTCGKSVAIAYLGTTCLLFLNSCSIDFTRYTHDLGAHLQYIFFIFLNNKVPSPTYGWATSHPPTYYLFSAGLLNFFNTFTTIHPIEWVRKLSMFSYLGFLLFGVLTCRHLIKTTLAFLTAAILLLYWPSGSVVGLRINNDLPNYFFTAASFYWFSKWYVNKVPRFFQNSLISAALAYSIKSSGLIMLCLIVVTALAFVIKSPGKIEFFTSSASRKILIALVLVFSLSMNLGRNITHKLRGEGTRSVFFGGGNHALHLLASQQAINNEPYFYLTFDYNYFLSHPFPALSAKTPEGAPSFWDHLVKKSLYTESPSGSFANLAQVVNFLALLILIGVLAWIFYILFLSKVLPPLFMCTFLFSALFILAIVCNCVSFPVTSHVDFRYIFPLLIAVSAFYGQMLDHLIISQLYRLAWLQFTIVAFFAAIATIFFRFELESLY